MEDNSVHNTSPPASKKWSNVNSLNSLNNFVDDGGLLAKNSGAGLGTLT